MGEEEAGGLALPFPELLQQGSHIFWEWGFEGVGSALLVGELQELGMPGEPGEKGAFVFFVEGEFEIPFERREKDWFGVAVEVVADDGVTEGLHVDADLVGAAGMDLELDQ